MPVLALVLVAAAFAAFAAGGDDSREASFNARGGGTAWEEVLREARGQTVRWWMFGGDDRINEYVDDQVVPAAREHGVTLERVPVGDTADAVQRVVAQPGGEAHRWRRRPDLDQRRELRRGQGGGPLVA